LTEPGSLRAARRALLVLTAALVVALAACVQPVGPARTSDSYEHKAKHTAETALSAVQTGRLGAQSARRDDTFAPYLAVLVSDAENEASGAQTTFDSVQPPNDRSDSVRNDLDPLLTRAVDALSQARIAARRADFSGVAKQDPKLARSARELNRFIKAHGG
jgi:type II secretory pathway pseudopilin PulG